MSLLQRFLTAVVLLAVLIVVVQWASPPVFFAVIQIVILAALLEFYNLAKKRKLEPRLAVGIGFALSISASFYVRAFPLDAALFAGLLAAGFVSLLAVDSIEKIMAFPGSLAITVLGAIYISFTLNYFYLLKIERGPNHLYFLFAVVFLGDTGAFLIGKLLGRHKMVPLASPNKTWEGAIGGILSAALGAVLARAIFLPSVGLAAALAGGVAVQAIAQLSDPVESLFKRAAGVKDSSGLLPGHGGVLDRIDSLLFAAPAFYYLVRFVWKG